MQKIVDVTCLSGRSRRVKIDLSLIGVDLWIVCFAFCDVVLEVLILPIPNENSLTT